MIRAERQAEGRIWRAVLAAVVACVATVASAQGAAGSSAAPTPAASNWSDWSNPTGWWPWGGDGKPPAPTGVQSPHYGDSLFHFFQGRYFTAVTGLMVSQHFARVAPHDDEAEVLRGGLFLSYGLHREAGDVFARLIERGATPAVRDRAWFYLAKIRYQRGLLAEAEDALGRIEQRLPGELEEDRVLLQANVQMARGRHAEAIRTLDTVAKSPGASSYVRYNLGIALIRGGDPAAGTALLDAVGKLPATSEEYRNLRDKANLALGFAALRDGRGDAARGYLERVRLSGMQSNKALLGFGWAAAAQGNMKAALVPWNELVGREEADAAVLEARLAVPYALAELGADAQALALYQTAIGAFDREGANLDRSVAAIREGRLLDGLVARNPGEEMGWFWSIADLPDAHDVPHGGHLAPLLATHEFQEAFKNYRDLIFLGHNLRQWQDTLGVLRDMLDNRRAAYAERLPQVRARELALGAADRGRSQAALTAELERVERDVDVAALATARERELQARLGRVREALGGAAGEPGLDEARERYRRASGALLWQQNEQFSGRLWSARKNLQELQRQVALAKERDAALGRAQRDEPARLDDFARRLDALAARVDAMAPRVDALAQQQRVAVQELAVAELLRQKERLAAYGTQARFAVAQIYDRAASTKEGSRAPAR